MSATVAESAQERIPRVQLLEEFPHIVGSVPHLPLATTKDGGTRRMASIPTASSPIMPGWKDSSEPVTQPCVSTHRTNTAMSWVAVWIRDLHEHVCYVSEGSSMNAVMDGLRLAHECGVDMQE